MEEESGQKPAASNQLKEPPARYPVSSRLVFAFLGFILGWIPVLLFLYGLTGNLSINLAFLYSGALYLGGWIASIAMLTLFSSTPREDSLAIGLMLGLGVSGALGCWVTYIALSSI